MSRNSTRMGVAPRSEAIEKYDTDTTVRVIIANWWNSRVPFGLCRSILVNEMKTCMDMGDEPSR